LFSRVDRSIAWLIDTYVKFVSVEELAFLLIGIRVISSDVNRGQSSYWSSRDGEINT
jgi:hypothetical protein